MLSFRSIVSSIGNYNYNLPPQLAHDVVTTLGFRCFLVATSDNVVTTLCFQRRYYNQTQVAIALCFRRRY